MSFGAFLRDRRVERGLTLADVAGASDISVAYLSRIERDRERPPPDPLLRSLGATLQLPEDDVFAAARRLPPDLQEHAGAVFAAYRRLSRGGKR